MPVNLNTGFDPDDPALISVLDELPFWSAPFGLKLLEKIIPRKYMTVIDIGYGTGFPLVELAMRLGDTCKVYGIDPWKAASDRAKEKIRIFGINNIELLAATAENIPLPEQSIDLVVSNNGLNNVADLDKALSECSRVLKPGGKIIFTMNLDGTMKEFYNVMESVLSDHGMTTSIESMKKQIYEKRKPLEEVQSLLKRNGFSEVLFEHDDFTYTFADGTTMFRHYFIRLAFLGSWKDIVPVDRQEEVFSMIEQKINQIAEKDGFFRLSIPYVVIEAIKC